MKIIIWIAIVLIYIIYVIGLMIEWLLDMFERLWNVIHVCIVEGIEGEGGLKKTIEKLLIKSK